MASLFRPEVIEGRQQAWLGSIQLVRPVPLAVLTALVVIVALLVGAFLFTGSYTRKAHVTGYLVPDQGVRRVYPQQPGIILESHAREGRLVRQGDVLYVLSLGQATASGDTQVAVHESLAERQRSLQEAARRATELDRQQTASLDRQLADMRTELAQIESAVDLQRRKLVLKRNEVEKFESLMKGDAFISETGLQVKKAEQLDVESHLVELAAKRTKQLRDIGILEAQRRKQPIDTQDTLGDIQRRIAALNGDVAENEARQTLQVKAPADGIVTAVLAQEGDRVSPNSVLASVVPAQATLHAELFAPSSAVGFVQAQQAVHLRYQAFPYQKFGHQDGQVLVVSRTPLQATELAGLPLRESLKATPSAEPLYRITVALNEQDVKAYGHAQPLVAGMQLEADVLLDKRPLIEWIFEPLLIIKGRV
jgi:membrane fusion protein